VGWVEAGTPTPAAPTHLHRGGAADGGGGGKDGGGRDVAAQLMALPFR
jgi:hypothetical protein